MTVVNAGIISGGTANASEAGIFLTGSASISNQASAVISGHEGIYGTGGATTVTGSADTRVAVLNAIGSDERSAT